MMMLLMMPAGKQHRLNCRLAGGSKSWEELSPRIRPLQRYAPRHLSTNSSAPPMHRSTRPLPPSLLTLVDVHGGQWRQEVVAHQHAEEHKVVDNALQVIGEGQAPRQRGLELRVKVVAQQAVARYRGEGGGREGRESLEGGMRGRGTAVRTGCTCSAAAARQQLQPGSSSDSQALMRTHPICSSTKCSWQGLSSTSLAGCPRPPPVKLTTSRSRQKWGSWVTRLQQQQRGQQGTGGAGQGRGGGQSLGSTLGKGQVGSRAGATAS